MESGTRIEHYEILAPLGEGGMGAVYRARDTRLERDVAIKVLRPELSADQAYGERLELEARLLASLSHPNVGGIFDLKERDGTRFLILEFVDGQPLDQILDRGPLRLAEVRNIGKQVASALAAAHSRGIVHRDLKPANVMVDARGVAKVLDFGIALSSTGTGGDAASAVPSASTPDSGRLESVAARLTSTGALVGTAPYMSPEQIGGEELDKRSDIWAYGCLLYELLVGRAPFERETLYSTLAAVVHDDPDLSRLPATTPKELVTLIERCLRKDREMRLHDVSDARLVLEDLGAVGPVGPGRRRVALAGLIAVAALAGALLLGDVLLQPGSDVAPAASEGASLGPRSVAVRSFNAGGDSLAHILALGLRDELVSAFSQADSIVVTSKTSTDEYDESGAPSSIVARELGVAMVLEGTARRAGQTLSVSLSLVGPRDQTLWSQTYRAPLVAEEVFDFQDRIAEETTRYLSGSSGTVETRATPRPTRDLDAYAFYVRGNEYALERFERDASSLAIDMYEEAIRLDPDFALAYAKLAQAHSLYFQFFDPSRDRQRAALEALDEALRLDPGLREARLAQAYVSYWVANDLEGALAQIEPLSAGSTDPEVLWIRGSVQRRLEMLEEARTSFARAVELDPRTPTYRFELAVTAWLLRDLDAAEELYRSALEISPESLSARFAYAIFLFVEGRAPDANRVLTEGLRYHGHETILAMLMDPRYRHVLGLAHPTFLEALDTLDVGSFDPGAYHVGKGLLYLGDDEPRARAHFDSARVAYEALVVERPGDPSLNASLSIALAGLGEADAAVEYAERAATLLPMRQDTFAGFPLVLNLARVQAMVGREEEAVQTLRSLLGHPRVYSRRLFETAYGFRALQGRADFERFLSDLEASR